MEDFKVGATVLPGDVVGKVAADIVIGPGLIQEIDSIIATKAGVLTHRAPNKYWIENKQKRYIPAKEELVIGIITEKQMEGYKVDIGGAHVATLSWEGFELSSRKNRPNFPVGGIIYCRVSLATKDMNPEVVCITSNGKAGVFGILNDGHLIQCSLSLCRSLLSHSTPVLQLLGQTIPYEIAIGLNGRVWIKSSNPLSTILVANTIVKSDGLSNDDIALLVNEMLTTYTKY